MSTTKAIQVSFAGGELSESMYGRMDDQKYQTGLAKCSNFLVLPQGVVQNRPGFSYVNAAKYSDKPVRLIPFRFNSEQTCVIELGDKYARFHTMGATLLAKGGEPYEIATPWDAKDVFDLHYVQSNDVLTFVHPHYPPQEMRRYSLTDWRVEAPDFGLKLDAPKGVSARRKTSADNDSNAEKYAFDYKVSALNSDKTQEGPASEKVTVTANLYATGTTVEISWEAVAGASFYRVYKNKGGLYGYIGDTEDLSIIDDGIAPETDVTPRRLDEVFKAANAITSVTVTNGGSGYIQNLHGAKLPEAFALDKPDECSSYYDTSGNPRTLPFSGNISNPGRPQTSYSGGSSGQAMIDKTLIEIVDLAGTGSGAQVSATFVTGTGTYEVPDSGEGYDTFTYTYATVTSVTITEAGNSYKKPALRIYTEYFRYGALGYKNYMTYRYTWELERLDTGITLNVIDSTGRGAELEAQVVDGAIASVKVLKGGEGYTDPQIRVISTTGTGAVLDPVVSGGGSYPAAVGYFEQRKCFAGMAMDPQAFVMTRTGTETDMSYCLPYKDDDQVYARLASNEFDSIEHIVSLGQMILLTSGSVAVISTKNSDAITPDSVNAVVQSSVGATTVRPLVVNNVVLYVGAAGAHVWELGYQYEKGGYVPGDMSLRAAHLFDFKTIVDSAQSRSPTPIMWFVSSDGKLLGMTYIPEQAIGAWHQHATDGSFESCTSVIEDGEDRLYCVVRREIQGQIVRYIERMNSRQIVKLEDAVFVDCAGQYKGPATTEISGLTWLEGKTVSILADGAVRPQQTVVDGKITLDAPASVVQVGLPYTSDLQTLPVTLSIPGYGTGNTKNVSRAFIRVRQSSGIFAGPSFDEADMIEYKQRTTEQPGTPPSLVSGVIDLQLYGKWTDSGAICLRQINPLPLEVLSVTLKVDY